MKNYISGTAFIEWLEAQGAIPADQPYQRVVIDASYDRAVVIYMQAVGTESLIESSAPDSLLQAEIKALV
jgi:hypothetical protein